jgi:sensor histidine kinase YesM
MLAITIDNNFDGVIEKEGGVYLSRKSSEDRPRGIGISSVQAVAQKYGGEARFEAKGNVFQVSVMLRVT